MHCRRGRGTITKNLHHQLKRQEILRRPVSPQKRKGGDYELFVRLWQAFHLAGEELRREDKEHITRVREAQEYL